MTDPTMGGDGEIRDMYAPDNAPQHRYEAERFASILRDYVAKHGRTRGLTEFIASIRGVSRPLLAGIVGILLIDVYDHERRGGERTLLSVGADIWDEVTGLLEGAGMRIDPMPKTERFQSPIYETYWWRDVVPAQSDGDARTE